MQTKEKILDGVAVLAGTGIGALSNFRSQLKEEIQSRSDDMASRLGLVPAEDMKRLEIMLMEAAKEREELKQRIELLENQQNIRGKTS